MDGSGSVAGLGLGLGVRGACTCAMIATWQQDGPDDAGWAVTWLIVFSGNYCGRVAGGGGGRARCSAARPC